MRISGMEIGNEFRSVGILALSAIADDPRVRRQGDAFHHAGWSVVAIGLPFDALPLPGGPGRAGDERGEF